MLASTPPHVRERQRNFIEEISRKPRCTMWPYEHPYACIHAPHTCAQSVRAEYHNGKYS